MAELVVAMAKTKSDVVSALKMKSMLWNKGIELSGMVVRRHEGNKEIPAGFLEDMLKLKVVGILT